MKTKKSNLRTLDQFKSKHYGKKGTTRRDNLQAGFERFKTELLQRNPQWRDGLIN